MTVRLDVLFLDPEKVVLSLFQTVLSEFGLKDPILATIPYREAIDLFEDPKDISCMLLDAIGPTVKSMESRQIIRAL